MQHVRLGNSGLKVSRICLGTMTFGLQVDEEGSRAILDHAHEGGVTFIDTADAYPLGGDLTTAGRTEEIVGRWLGTRRADFVVATKCVAPMGRRRGIWATVAVTLWTRSTHRCAASAPTGSTCINCISTTLACRSTRRSRRSMISCALARSATSVARIFSRTDSRVRSGAVTLAISRVSFRYSRDTTCCSASSSVNCFRCVRKKASA